MIYEYSCGIETMGWGHYVESYILT